jgi:hypothetical protein
MRSKARTICVLTVFIVTGLDCFPDPPAITPQRTTVSFRLTYLAPGSLRDSALKPDLSRASLVPLLRWINLRVAEKSKLVSDWIVLSGNATDPSPPPRPSLSLCNSKT